MKPEYELIFRLADDDLIAGHRASEWTGLAPVLEEDIAGASMAQDQVGHAQSYYELLSELGTPDALAFGRKASEFRNARMVEYAGTDDYAVRLVRHWLYDTAKAVRLAHLTRSTYTPLAQLAVRISREHKYHLAHAETMIVRLGRSSARERIRSAFDRTFAEAFGLFEVTPATEVLAQTGVMTHENTLRDEWLARIHETAQKADLLVPENPDPTPHLGGRFGHHSEDLEQLIEEMTEVLRLDPNAVW
jgi:ring-1,2-phenylacetyl-CoA epoxidase subunit PaaC